MTPVSLATQEYGLNTILQQHLWPEPVHHVSKVSSFFIAKICVTYAVMNQEMQLAAQARADCMFKGRR